jgi:hypothetical protein
MQVVLEWLFDWLLVSIVVPTLIGVGLTLLADEFKQFRAARVCFYLATAWIFGKALMWSWSTQDRFLAKALIGFFVFGIVGVALIGVLHLTANREKAVAREASPAGPDLSAIANDVAEIKKNTTPVPERHLTIEQIQYLQANLERYGKQPVRVSFLIGDVESQKYAQEIVSVLASPPLRWEAGLGLPSQFNFSGVAVAVQDPTEVPPAAEALASSLEALGVKILRIPQSNAVSIDGNKASPIFEVWISNRGGDTVLPPRKKMELDVRHVSSETPVATMSSTDLEAAAHDLADAMRTFEATNKVQFANEWHISGKPLQGGSYRFAFETYRKRALEIRSELWKRLNSQPATTFALDADYLGGPSPITDAANYLEELAKQLRGAASASPAPNR